MSGEVWSSAGLGYPYEVSSDGRVRSYINSRKVNQELPLLLAGTVTASGYRRVLLTIDGVRSARYVHRLVARAFLGPCPEDMEVCHNNGIRSDNRVENLRYGTRSDNVRDSIRHGTNINAAKTHCLRGHEFSESNTHYRPRGGRVCLRCNRGDY